MASSNDPFLQRYLATGPEEETGNWFGSGLGDTVSDLGMGVANGAEEAIRSTLGLAQYTFMNDRDDDTVAWDIIDSPDTIVGGLAEGITQFAVGSALVSAATTGILATIGVAAAPLAGVVAGAAFITKAAVRVAAAQRKLKTLSGIKGKMAQYAYDAIMVDAVAFQGDQGRFVDILNQSPEISNAVFDFIDGDEDDSVLEARLKNGLDGIIGGGVMDATVGRLVKMINGKKAAKAAKNLEERLAIEEQTKRAIESEPVELITPLMDLRNQQTIDLYKGLDSKDSEFLAKISETVEAVQLGELEEEDLREILRADGRKMSPGIDTFLENTDEAIKKDADTLNVNQIDLPQNKEFFEGEGVTPADIGPVNYTAGFKSKLGAFQTYEFYRENQDVFRARSDEDPQGILQRIVDKAMEETGEDIDTLVTKAQVEALDALSALNVSTATAREFMSHNAGHPAKVLAAARVARKSKGFADIVSRDIEKVLGDIKSGKVEDTSAAREQIARGMSTLFGVTDMARDISSAHGRALESLKREISPNAENSQIKRALERLAKENYTDPAEYYRTLALASDASPAAKAKLERFEENLVKEFQRATSPGDFLKRAQGLAGIDDGNIAGKFVISNYISNIISGPKTLMTAVMSPVIIQPYQSLRRVYGSFFDAMMEESPEAIERITKTARDELKFMHKQAYYAADFARKALSRDVDLSKVLANIQGNPAFEQQVGVVEEFGNQVADQLRIPSRYRPLLNAAHKFAVPGRWAPALIDRIQQAATFKASAELQFTDEFLSRGMDPKQAAEAAREAAEAQLFNADKLYAHYTGDRVMSRALAREDVGEIGASAAIEREINIAQNDRAVASEIFEEARGRASAVTLTSSPKDLSDPDTGLLGSRVGEQLSNVGAVIADANKKLPYLRLFTPFLTVPTNVAALSLDVVVGGMMESFNRGMAGSTFGYKLKDFPGMEAAMRASRSGNPNIRRNQAVNQMVAGSIMTTFGVFAAQPGLMLPTEDNPFPVVTGGGPTDPDRRKALQDAGWQPYSIRIGGKYYSYQRAEPLASWLSILSDTLQVAQYVSEANDDQAIENGLNVVTTVLGEHLSRQFTDKTFTRGLGDLFSILDGNERALDRWTQNFTSSLLVPATVNQAAQAMDPDLRAAQGIVEKMMARIPGVSTQLKDRRRDLLGEPIKRGYVGDNALLDMFVPTRVSEIKDSVVRREIASIPYDWQQAPSRYKGVVLTDPELDVDGQSMHDLWQEKTAEITLRGKTLRQALRVLIQDPEYKKLSPVPDEQGQPSERASLINSVINRYRKSAFSQITRDNPELARRVDQYRRADRARRSNLSTSRRTLLD